MDSIRSMVAAFQSHRYCTRFEPYGTLLVIENLESFLYFQESSCGDGLVGFWYDGIFDNRKTLVKLISRLFLSSDQSRRVSGLKHSAEKSRNISS
mmetsp:Transcript_13336/g.21501  ORF Transcript_13336/g.21501 Transcript_13336/m.21501 type:complete len:95 (+) Transcript_13336:794-1078(+)